MKNVKIQSFFKGSKDVKKRLKSDERIKLFQKSRLFVFESICVPSEELKTTEKINWIGNHEPIALSISSL